MAHIRKFDREWTRRAFLQGVGGGALTTGLLSPLWDTIAKTGEAHAAYPEELQSIDTYTKGKISTGDIIDENNVDLIKELFDPIRYHQFKNMGRKVRVVKSTQDIMKLSPRPYIEATLRNQGQAMFAPDGNVVTKEGKPWIGGNPFPDPKNAIEAYAGLTLSWGRHDISFFATKEYDLGPGGRVDYRYEGCWAELATVGRTTVDPMPYWKEDKLRYQTVLFTSPHEFRGTSFLNIWHYDQNRFPELYGYVPAFKRIRRFPTNQRFEPLIAGSTLYLSDAWGAGDPFLTWGNYRVKHRGPTLAALSGGFNSNHPNWEHSHHGGPHGETFWDMDVEFVPEALVLSANPVKFPRAPVSTKDVWFDARTLLPLVMVSYDRRGKAYRSFDGSYASYDNGDMKVMDGADPYWSWTVLHAHNIQTNRMTRIEQVKEIAGGHHMRVNDQDVYDLYLTKTAIRRLGD